MYFWLSKSFMETNKSSFLYKISEKISNIFNPMVSLLSFFVFNCIKNLSLKQSLHNFLFILIMVIIPVIVWIFWNVKRGKYQDADVSNRKSRMTLYLFIEFSISLYIITKLLIDKEIDSFMLFVMILLCTLHISNFFIKSSMHTAFNILAAAFFFAQSSAWGVAWLGIAICVGITRIILKRHTISEVISGTLIASMVSFIYLYIN